METDQSLLNAAKRMDQDALVKIFDLYSPILYKYVLRLCSDPVMADHIVGDVFAKLLDQLAAGNGPKDNLRSYLYEIAYHRIIDEARHTRRHASLDVATWLRGDAKPIFLTLEDQLLLQQILQAIQNELTDDQRQVIILRFLEEFSTRETAAILGKSIDHVRVIQNRAIAALRRCLEYQGVVKVVLSPRFRSLSDPAAPLGVPFTEHPAET